MDYYLLGFTVCREKMAGDRLIAEYYRVGEGWLSDRSTLHRDIHDAMFGYGYMSPGDLTTLTEETACRIIAKQEELGKADIPGLHRGGSYVE